MTDFMLTLYQFAVTRRMGYLMEDPEYADCSRCVGVQTERLRARLDRAGQQNLDDLMGELELKHSTEQEAVFQAAFSLSRELNGLLRP